MNNYDEKIINIKETEKQLLEFAKTKISENNTVFDENVSSLIKTLSYDDKIVKKYEAIVTSQKLIKDLADEIKDATSVEEIIAIRKKLNYYINKIKKEIKDRDICSGEIDKYALNANNLRKGISEYIRYLKRENKINEIEFLNDKSDKTEEESIKLKRLLNNEVSYGKRNIAKYVNNMVDEKKETKENVAVKKPIIQGSRYIRDCQIIIEDDDSFKNQNEMVVAIPGSRYIKGYRGVIVSNDKVKESQQKQKNQYIKEQRSIVEKKYNKTDNLENHNRGVIRATKTYDSLYDFLDEKVSVYANQFKIVTPKKYTKNVIKNITIFTKNIPIILKNKSKVKDMENEYVLFRRKPELSGYLEYVRRDSSIINNFKKAIAGSSLKNKEEYYEEEHRKCIAWIMQFFKDNNIKCTYNKHV